MTEVHEEYSLSLILRAEAMDHDLVTQQLGIQPSRVWTKGDQRFSADGRPGYIVMMSGWSRALKPDGEGFSTLEAALTAFSGQFSSKISTMQQLAKHYPDSIIDLVLFTSETSTIALNFTNQQLAQLVAFGFDVETTIYTGMDGT